jgi:hypothetical protein
MNAFSLLWLKNIDPRRYAIARIGFALLLLSHFVHLFPYRDTILSNAGMTHSSAAKIGFYQLTGGTSISLFNYFQSSFEVTIIFIFAIIASLTLAWGKWARTTLFVCFFIQLSFIHRAPASTTGWDSILTNLGFILLFSPLGKDWNPWNLFRQWNKKQLNLKAPQYGLVLIQLQVFIIYWQTVIQKLDDQYWAKGESITYFLLSHHGRFPGSWPVAWHDLLDKINYLTLIIELAIPILLWIRNTRRLGLWIGIGLHLSIAILGVNLALFSLTMIVSYLAFIDPWPTPYKLKNSTK